MKHTKGKWKVTALTNYCHQVLPKAVSPEEHLANAALIEQAPAMLNALENLIDFCEALAADGGRSADLRQAYKVLQKLNK